MRPPRARNFDQFDSFFSQDKDISLVILDRKYTGWCEPCDNDFNVYA
jgi:hypothetical protein